MNSLSDIHPWCIDLFIIDLLTDLLIDLSCPVKFKFSNSDYVKVCIPSINFKVGWIKSIILASLSNIPNDNSKCTMLSISKRKSHS